jgi:CheY-like chemotaxis protein
VRILLAEDERINQLYLLHLLQGAGHQVTLAADGIEAVELVTRDAFDVVLMDVQMPRQSGVDATMKIRELSDGASSHDIPIIALTAHSTSRDKASYSDAGFTEVVAKPIDEKALLALIKRYAE